MSLIFQRMFVEDSRKLLSKAGVKIQQRLQSLSLIAHVMAENIITINNMVTGILREIH